MTALSVIIPSYNDFTGLERILRYYGDLDAPVQLIIVNDCSTDETTSLKDGVLDNGSELIVLHNETNLGAARSRMRGLKQATGDLVHFLDADDIPVAGCYTYVFPWFDNTNVDFVVFQHHIADPAEKDYNTYQMEILDDQLWGAIRQHKPAGRSTVEQTPEMLRTINYPWNKVYRRKFLIDSGIEFPNLRMQEDVIPHWSSFLRAKSYAILTDAPPLVHHFVSKKAKRATNASDERRFDCVTALEMLWAELEINGSDVSRREFAIFAPDLLHWAISTVEDFSIQAKMAAMSVAFIAKTSQHPRWIKAALPYPQVTESAEKFLKCWTPFSSNQ